MYRSALWIVGEYAESPQELRAALASIKKLTGGARLIKPPAKEVLEEPTDVAAATGPRMNADGTYASASAISVATKSAPTKVSEDSFLRAALLKGDSFLASSLGTLYLMLCVHALMR